MQKNVLILRVYEFFRIYSNDKKEKKVKIHVTIELKSRENL